MDADQLRQLLIETKYDKEEIEFLYKGFTEGFDLQYRGPEERQSLSKNLPFMVGNKTELWGKLMKEVKMARVAGPFSQILFQNFMQSPIGLVPKAGSNDQTRLIFHLSYEFEDGLGSLNSNTPPELCTVKYRDIDFAVNAMLRLRKKEEKK